MYVNTNSLFAENVLPLLAGPDGKDQQENAAW